MDTNMWETKCSRHCHYVEVITWPSTTRATLSLSTGTSRLESPNVEQKQGEMQSLHSQSSVHRRGKSWRRKEFLHHTQTVHGHTVISYMQWNSWTQITSMQLFMELPHANLVFQPFSEPSPNSQWSFLGSDHKIYTSRRVRPRPVKLKHTGTNCDTCWQSEFLPQSLAKGSSFPPLLIYSEFFFAMRRTSSPSSSYKKMELRSMKIFLEPFESDNIYCCSLLQFPSVVPEISEHQATLSGYLIRLKSQ